MRSPQHYKARLLAIENLITNENSGNRSEKNNNAVLLRNGVVPNDLKKEYDKQLSSVLKQVTADTLTFEDITRFNNWFEMHPEKVAGKEIITTSIQFPISIKGTKEDIISMFKNISSTTKINVTGQQDKDKRIRIAKVKAQAKLKTLKLLKA